MKRRVYSTTALRTKDTMSSRKWRLPFATSFISGFPESARQRIVSNVVGPAPLLPSYMVQHVHGPIGSLVVCFYAHFSFSALLYDRFAKNRRR